MTSRTSTEELERLIARKRIPDRRDRQLRAVRIGLTKEEVSKAERTAESVLDRMEAHLSGGGEWLLGELSLADVSAIPNVHRYFQLGLDEVVERRPSVLEWYRRWRERPSFRSAYTFDKPGVRLTA